MNEETRGLSLDLLERAGRVKAGGVGPLHRKYISSQMLSNRGARNVCRIHCSGENLSKMLVA